MVNKVPKVCHITTVHPRYDIRIFHRQCVSLIKAGYDVSLIVNDAKEDEIADGVSIESIRVNIQSKIKRILSRRDKNLAYKKALSKRCDIYQIHDPELIRVALKLKRKGFRVIYDSHEDVPRQILYKEWIPRIFRRLVSSIFEKYENHFAKKIDAVIVPTPFLKSRFDLSNKNVYIVSNFPSLSEASNKNEEYSSDNPAIYIGGLSATRGIYEISTATFKANIGLLLCGNFISNGLKEKISSYNNVSHLGYLGRQEISKALRSSSMGFVTLHNTPNDAESYPIKMFEYMSAGIPVIASNFKQYSNIIENNNCGICVDPTNIDEIYQAVRFLNENAEYAKNLGENGRLSIIHTYNWENQFIYLINCYQKLLED